jgi:hypothetical protein
LEGDSLEGDPCDPHFFELNEECGTRYEQISDGDSTHCYGILSNSDVGTPQIHHHVHATCLVTATFCDSLCATVRAGVTCGVHGPIVCGTLPSCGLERFPDQSHSTDHRRIAIMFVVVGSISDPWSLLAGV